METGQLMDIWIEQAKIELHKLQKNQLFFYTHHRLARTGTGEKMDKTIEKIKLPNL